MYDIDGLSNLLSKEGYNRTEILTILDVMCSQSASDIELILNTIKPHLQFHLSRRLSLDLFRQIYGKCHTALAYGQLK